MAFQLVVGGTVINLTVFSFSVSAAKLDVLKDFPGSFFDGAPYG